MSYYPCRQPYKILENLIYLGEIPRKNDFENLEPVGRQERAGRWEEDYLMDDTALAYKDTKGIFIITGCSHSGICNIIEYAREVCKEQKVLGILGGFHLLNDDERLYKTIRYLESCEMEKLYPCHCISLSAKAKMMEKYR